MIVTQVASFVSMWIKRKCHTKLMHFSTIVIGVSVCLPIIRSSLPHVVGISVVFVLGEKWYWISKKSQCLKSLLSIENLILILLTKSIPLETCFLFQAKVIMKNANVAAKLQEALNDCDTESPEISENCLADIQAVIQTVCEWGTRCCLCWRTFSLIVLLFSEV